MVQYAPLPGSFAGLGTRINFGFLLLNNILCGLIVGLRLLSRGRLEVSDKLDSTLFLLLGLLGLLVEDVSCYLIN